MPKFNKNRLDGQLLLSNDEIKVGLGKVLKAIKLNKNMKYSIKKGFSKVVKYFVIFLLPILVNEFIIAFPEIAQLSVGAILVGAINFIKIKYGVKV